MKMTAYCIGLFAIIPALAIILIPALRNNVDPTLSEGIQLAGMLIAGAILISAMARP